MIKSFTNIFTFFIFLIIFLSAIFFGVREYLLLKALNDLKNATTQAILNQSIKAVARKNCRNYAKRDGVKYHLSPQVRFTSTKSFFSGYVCNHDYENPIIEKEYKLPPLVKKISENTGIIIDEESQNPGVMIEVLGRRGAVWYEKRLAITSTNKKEIKEKKFDIGPVTNCEVYGFVCCDGIGKVPSGRQFFGAVDCEHTCYEKCSQEPAIIFFTSQPFYESATRNLHIKTNEVVKFSFQITSNDAADNQKIPDVSFFFKFMQFIYDKFTADTKQSDNNQKTDIGLILDFGDGSNQAFSSLQGVVEHEYTCGTDNCNYQAILKITNNGQEVVQNELSDINIIIR